MFGSVSGKITKHKWVGDFPDDPSGDYWCETSKGRLWQKARKETSPPRIPSKYIASGGIILVHLRISGGVRNLVVPLTTLPSRETPGTSYDRVKGVTGPGGPCGV